MVRGVFRNRLVRRGIVQGDNFAVHFHRVGKPDLVMVDTGQRFCNCSFARTSRAVEKYRPTGHDGGTDLRKGLLAYYEVLESPLDISRVNFHILDALLAHTIYVLLQRYWGWPNVMIERE